MWTKLTAICVAALVVSGCTETTDGPSITDTTASGNLRREYVRFTDRWKEEGLYDREARNPVYDFSARFDAYAVLQSCIVAASTLSGDRYPDRAIERDTLRALRDELLRDKTPDDIDGEDASVRKALLHINDLCGFIDFLAMHREEETSRTATAQQSTDSAAVDLSPIVTIGGNPCVPIGENTFRCAVNIAPQKQD